MTRAVVEGVLDVGVGVREAVEGGGSGTVVATFRRAAYVQLGDAIVAVTTPAAPAGPLHLRCRQPPTLRTGEPVRVEGRSLCGRRWRLRADGPVRDPGLPDPGPLRTGWTELADLIVLDPETRALQVDDLAAVAARIGGRGPGLTPAGDDLLAGLVIVAHARGVAEERLRAVAAGVATTPIARAFLAWAARGRSIAPVHDLLAAIARRDRTAADHALGRLLAVGASSGVSLAAGLALGLDAQERLVGTESQTARATAEPVLTQRTGWSVG